MPETRNLLWEVGCEELPAWACDAIERQLPTLVTDALVGARLGLDDALPVVWVGPRRFSVLVEVRTEQLAVREESRGPAVRVAFEGGDPSGAPTKACEGFARGKGLTPADLEVRESDGSQFVFAVRDLPAAPFAGVWPALAQRIVEGLQFAKPMRWGATQHRFVRPIRWMVTLLGEDVVPYDVWGVPSGRSTRTHRFLGAARATDVATSDAYAGVLGGAFVQVDQATRRSMIEEGLATAAREFGGEYRDPGNVLKEVVHLVEHPTVITGRFADRYLQLPERVLVTAMQSHQRYLPVHTADGSLAPAFLAVMNADPAATASILPGYERVIAGRLDDAVFSFDRDRARGLDDMATDESLGAVVFHAKAGSLADRRDRLAAIADDLAAQVGIDQAAVADAARLAKADQVSTVVQEFAELEGFAGSLYAADAGYSPQVAAAIDQQFLPRGADDRLPETGVPSVIAIADKLDLLVTMHAIGEPPTGSRDPHGLRRAAIGVMRMVLEHDLAIDLDAALATAGAALRTQGHGEATPATLVAVREFILDRVEKRLADDGVRVDAVRAARAAGLARLQQLDELARAIDQAVRAGSAGLTQVLDAVKRCTKILEQAGVVTGELEPARFESDAERALHARLAEVGEPLAGAVEARRFNEALELAAGLGPEVEAFFARDTGVMIMAEDPAVRQNRLLLVRGVLEVLDPLGDLTALQV